MASRVAARAGKRAGSGGWVEYIDSCHLGPRELYSSEAMWRPERAPFLLTGVFATPSLCRVASAKLNGRDVLGKLDAGVLVSSADTLRVSVVSEASAPLECKIGVYYRHAPLALPIGVQVTRACAVVLALVWFGFLALQALAMVSP